MPVTLSEKRGGKVLEMHVSGKLGADDYQQLVPAAERLIAQHGKIRVLFDMHDFHGWQRGEGWEDILFDLKHFRDVERLALVGEKPWEHSLVVYYRPFTVANIRYFDRKDIDQARAWLEGD